MDEQSRILLAIASRVLNYPTVDYFQDMSDIVNAIEEELDSAAARQKVNNAIQPLYQMPLQQLKELYVETFDLKEKTGLYLTAHELGDSRKRGVELIALQNLIQNAGFLFRIDELADYIPMLYEFLAAVEADETTDRLSVRLSLVTERIRKFLPDDNLYKPIFNTLMDVVFQQPSSEDLEKMEQSREKPDLDPMPYPLMYK
jgi:nitrate reductase molybdenum cofactor assembly chaperone NarJ/NarW